MRKLNNTIIVAVDTGYGNIKTANTVTPTGITAYDTEPTFTGEILQYNNKYYRIGEGHKAFIADKVIDDDFYVLTLAAIAKELDIEGITTADVHIAAGLPLTWVKTQREEFRKYLTKNSKVKFTFRDKQYNIRIVNASVYPQGYTAVIDRLTDLHIRIIFMNDGIDTNDKDGELRLSIMASIAQEESRKMSERIKWGMKRRMEKGEVLGCGRIYGYKINKGELVVVPEEAEIVKDIFNMYLYEGKGYDTIAHELEARGIPTLKKRIWSPQHVLKILKNDKYVGDLTQWKVYKPNVLAERTLTNHGDNPDAPLITVKNHHEPIISREMWDNVQAELKRRSYSSRKGKKHSNGCWLSGKMKCGKCGYSMVMSHCFQNSSFTQMRCRNRIMYGKDKRTAMNGDEVGCDSRGVDERIVMKAMDSIVSQMSELRLLLEQEMLSEIQRLEKRKKDFDPTSLKDEIETYEEKKRKAIDLVLDGLISKDDLAKQTKFYDGEIVRLTEEITKLQNVAENQRNQLSEIEKAIEYIVKLSDTDTDGDNKELYRSMINTIIVPDYPILQIHLNGVPFAYEVVYSVKKAPRIGFCQINIDSCKVMS